MFDQLVVSSLQRRRYTSAKYFVGTGALYMLVIACAVLASVVLSDPKLADTADVITLIGPPLPAALGTPRPAKVPSRPTQTTAQPDLYHVQRLVDIMDHHSSAPPTFQTLNREGDETETGPGTGSTVLGSRIGVPGGEGLKEPAPRPDPPRPQPLAQTTQAIDNRPVRVPSSVLQGKAIERRKPSYPPLAQQIHLQGEVSVEVMIAPDGHIESARVVSGHPMFSEKAREAALGWRFQPTLLNNTPVRVTGVIVFVFKLSE
ncbi:MAG TPA: energy transducer TonB [Blastocatellia bacterium]|nr:energy transducer TonB [Blastocatellia bacterium]